MRTITKHPDIFRHSTTLQAEQKDILKANEILRGYGVCPVKERGLRDGISAAIYDARRSEILKGYRLSETELKTLKEWDERHLDERHGKEPYAGAIGGRLSYIFTPTGLGVISKVKCMCGEEFNLTDWDHFG